MISKIGQIMLYVNNQEEAVRFWAEDVGFTIVADENDGQGMRWIEIAPNKEVATCIVLPKKLIAEM